MTIWLMAGLIVGLVLVHMARPRFPRRSMSAARFFHNLPAPRKGAPRLRFGSPMDSYPFRLQALLFLIMLAAFLLENKGFSGPEARGFGLWLLVDTSASMSARQEEITRMELARREAAEIVREAQNRSEGMALCVRLSVLDMEIRDLIRNGSSAEAIESLKHIRSRPMGTDLGLVRPLRTVTDVAATEDCPITHLAVVTDRPAPEWSLEPHARRLVWRDIGQPLDNTGITAIQASRNPLTGTTAEIQLEVTAFGTPHPECRLTVSSSDGGVLLERAPNWDNGPVWQTGFQPPAPGEYEVRLNQGGDYAFDDRARIRVADSREVLVDWRIPDRALPQALGWKQDTATPHLRVVPNILNGDNTPLLIVGNGYRESLDSGMEIRDFIEDSPLTADLNFDFAERIEMASTTLAENFQPVLRFIDGRVGLATRRQPPAAYIPGLPTGADDDLGRFSATVFFNAVRWLLQNRSFEPLYELTNPNEPEVAGTRIALHPGEGDTSGSPSSSGSFRDLVPVAMAGTRKPVWPYLLFIALGLFALERVLSVYGGGRWH